MNIDYEISGSFTATDADGRFVDLYVFLYDESASIPLFDNYQQSLATPNERLTVGESGGDSQNSLIGTLTRTLVAGTYYSFYAAAQLASIPDSGSGATGTGTVTLTFVPEPSTAMLLATGILALAAGRRRS